MNTILEQLDPQTFEHLKAYATDRNLTPEDAAAEWLRDFSVHTGHASAEIGLDMMQKGAEIIERDIGIDELRAATSRIGIRSQKLLTPEEIAEHMKVDPRTVRYWVSAGKLKSSCRPGRPYIFSWKDLQEFKKRHVVRRQRSRRHLEDQA